ncbi:hypothetical protein DFJ74DRAFT_708055 [Hyaloraphidium curvatum]|nr:hypothetical protein DFJ74DRAFT_708055 [Hyaloraphidium curvatum]
MAPFSGPAQPSKLVRKVAIVTGGASGFGASVARKLAARGAIVAILDRDREGGEAVVRDLVDNYSGELDIENFIFVEVDLADLKDLKRAFDKVVDRYGTIDIMVNNAALGLGDDAFLKALDPKSDDGAEHAPWALMNRVNIDAVVYGSQLAVAEMRRASGGRGKKGVVVNTASMAAFFPQDDLPVYAAGKAAVVHFTRSLHEALLPKDGSRPPIRLNAVCPAAAVTGLLREQMRVAARAERTRAMLESYQVPVDRVADAIVLAVEEEALAGEVIRVTPKGGIETWDFKGNKRKELLSKI